MNAIDGGDISYFNNTKVLGDFNNDGFILHLEDIGDHDYVFVSFDLYIHGSWDGNFNGSSEQNRVPDKWIMESKPEMSLYNDPDNYKYVTTYKTVAWRSRKYTALIRTGTDVYCFK